MERRLYDPTLEVNLTKFTADYHDEAAATVARGLIAMRPGESILVERHNEGLQPGGRSYTITLRPRPRLSSAAFDAAWRE